MHGHVPLRFLMVLVVLLLSGCADPGSSAKTVPAASADAGDGAARILGRVVDLEQRPLPEVTIRIIPKSDATADVITLSTGQDGTFVAAGLTEGVYTLLATKPGYRDLMPLDVDAAAGADSNVILTMQEQRALVPFHTSFSRTLSFTGHVCAITPVATRCQTAFNPANLTTIFENKEERTGPLQTLLVQAAWTPNIGVCANGVQHHVFSPEQKDLDLTFVGSNDEFWGDENPYHWDNVPEATRNPTRLEIRREGDPLAMLSPERSALNQDQPISLEGDWKVQSWPYSARGGLGTPVDIDCMVQQAVTLWVSAFYLEPAPEAWSVFDNG